MPAQSTSFHGTCVALGEVALLLRGASGAGKSDLAYRFLHLPQGERTTAPILVADDQVVMTRDGDRIYVAPPPAIAGKLELRGIGILDLPYLNKASLRLVVDLCQPEEIERLPDWTDRAEYLGIELPLIRLSPFQTSAALKLRSALDMSGKEFSSD